MSKLHLDDVNVSKCRVCLVGVFPPPLHGMSLINSFIKDNIVHDSQPLIIDFSPGSFSRSFLLRIRKTLRVFKCIFVLMFYLSTRKVGTVYLGLSGGAGQIFDMLFCAASRLFGRKLYLHHHSYNYIDKHRWISKVLFLVAGKSAIHIVACEVMERDLRAAYKNISEVRVVSGIAALEPWHADVNVRENIQTIGFLGNICFEKGIVEFLDVAAWAGESGLQLVFLIAGPYQNDGVRRYVEDRINVIPNVQYIGPIYKEQKLLFFDSIDVLLMPSHSESEGLVIHEAMSRAVPSIAFSRGCIEQIVSNEIGRIVQSGEDYAISACDQIVKWRTNPSLFRAASQAALDRFSDARAHHLKKINSLCKELIGSV